MQFSDNFDLLIADPSLSASHSEALLVATLIGCWLLMIDN